jgi:hypothetical protein
MIYRGLVCLLLGAMAWGQAADPAPSAAPQKPATSDSAPAATAPPEGKAPEPAQVAPDAPVITIPGVCDHPPADPAGSPDCKLVVTRKEFENLLSAIAPNMPITARKQLASRYAMGLVMAHKAHEAGLDQGPRWEERLKVVRMQALAQAFNEHLQEKAGQVPDKDIEDYYQKNASSYDEASLDRLFIPKSKQFPASKEKLTAAETQKRQKDGNAAMKTEAEALRARAAKGEDIGKLQKEAYVFAGLKSKAPSPSMGKTRRSGLPPNHVSVMDLKPGQVSPVIADPSGYFVYKMGEKSTIPLDKVREEIRGSLKSQRMQESTQAIQHASAPTLDENYFAIPAAAPPQVTSAPAPGANPPVKATPPEHK